MHKVLTFGEIILRFSTSGNKRIQQATQFDFYIGGTELNVATSLANFGVEVKHVSNVSNDLFGEAVLNKLRGIGVDCSYVNKVKQPLGMYFLEVGASIRPSRIIYNRLKGSFSTFTPNLINWKDAFQDVEYFYWTGISPGISESILLTLTEGLKVASTNKIITIVDPTFRKNLWNYGKKGHEILKQLIAYTNIFIGGVNEINQLLDTNYKSNKEGFIEASIELTAKFPTINKVFDKVRVAGNASKQTIYSRVYNGSFYAETSKIEINNIVDRIGTGDAFSAGVIYGLKNYKNDSRIIEFANAAFALKHTIQGDMNLVSVGEVMEIVEGNHSGRIKR